MTHPWGWVLQAFAILMSACGLVLLYFEDLLMFAAAMVASLCLLVSSIRYRNVPSKREEKE